MLVRSECIPCYLKQAHNTLERTELSDTQMSVALNKICTMIPSLPLDARPSENSSKVMHFACELAGVVDPFEGDKRESNQQAMELWPELRELIQHSPDRLFTAFKVAVAGNVVDLGILEGYDLNESLRQTLKTDFSRDDYIVFRQLLERTGDVLIIGDNSGEIAFDRLLAEELVRIGAKVTYVVKAGPVLNDATQVDAEMVGMGEVAEVITTGNNFLGVVLDRSSEQFLSALKRAGCVISKGQANYESLEGQVEAADKTFFVFKAKCELVAENLGITQGDIVLARNK